MSAHSESTVIEERSSIFQSEMPLEAKLEKARTELLDLSARNRLLSMPRSAKSARILEIIDEKPSEIFRILVRENKSFTFLPGRPDPSGATQEMDDLGDEITELALPDDDSVDERGVLNRHADTKLQTRLTPAGLQKRLLDLYFDARTLEEEQGVNILFLALGALKWIDPGNAANVRYAPLILIPVALERGNVGEKFKLRWRQEDLLPNLSLEAYLDRIHNLKMPAFDTDDDFDPVDYIAAVADAISGKDGWNVNPDDAVLGFFSFAKFLMYRDLDPDNWPPAAKITEQPLIRSVLSEGFEASQDIIPEDAKLDSYIPPSDMLHIVDSDSSQTLAVHDVRSGRNIVIQGPPGTGKSQTIANIIASAVADGKTVLFVAEKMAALEVVKRRLDKAGVGDACLELHSNKTNKRAIIEELRRTWELGSPKGEQTSALNTRLKEALDRLNDHAERLHEQYGTAGHTPYQVIGQLTRLKQGGQLPSDIKLVGPELWSADDLRCRQELLNELIERVIDIGRPADHVWRGIRLENILPTDVDRLVTRMDALVIQLDAVGKEHADIASSLELLPPVALHDFDDCLLLSRRISMAPPLSEAALSSPEWEIRPEKILALVGTGAEYADCAGRLEGRLIPAAWSTEPGPILEAIDALPDSFPLAAFSDIDRLTGLLPSLIDDAELLAKSLGQEVSATIRAMERAINIGECVSKAPDASPEAFASDLWDNGIERARDITASVATLEAARAKIGTQLVDAAWSTDLTEARKILAFHGGSYFRYFSGEWRRANRLVKSLLANPKMILAEILPLLDALARGRSAILEIDKEDGFGRSAFGSHWRGEKSSSAPLVALVEWMQGLRGLGAEPRIIASRQPDRAEIGDQCTRLRLLLNEAKPLLQRLWANLNGKHSALFGDAASFDRVELRSGQVLFKRQNEAYEVYRDIAVATDNSLSDARRLLGILENGQSAARDLSAGEDLGTAAFGTAWCHLATDWPALHDAATWIAANLDIRLQASRIENRTSLLRRAEAAAGVRDRLVVDLASFLVDIECDRAEAFESENVDLIPADELSNRIRAWISASELLSKWIDYNNRAARGQVLGLGEIVDRLHDGRLAPGHALPAFDIAYYEAVLVYQAKARPELARFDGALHNRLVREFIDLDRERISASSLEVVRSHYRKIPPQNGGAVGPLGILRGEIARRRGHMPIRQLMQRAAPAVQALKPVLMMSPLSVAQFLPPGALTFDLLVMDEASQIQPVDALGAIGRSRQVVIVGDPQQLPPTAFFAKTTGSDSPDEDEDGAKVADIESILGLFTARGLQTRMLRWHYRSRHQSLIAVSNKQFYENKLIIIPSPYTAEAGMGLRFHHVQNGIFETGATRTNPIEAKIVAQAIVAHAIERSEQSLGVAAFSSAQRRAIQDQLELLRRGLAPEHEAFFQSHPSEPFFIKNLENVQGDERDTIFISVGYGPSAPGAKPAMRFGPLGIEGGERRLNVLISRAKRRCEVFSSITDEDIDPDFARTRKGVFAFKLFLHFARTGRMTLTESTGRDRDGVFEEQVAKALHARGYTVHQNVGIAGLFVDLAVADPERPDRYVLGVECDGSAYYASRSARDRDRLRQSVLEDHGWIMYRIWSADWLKRPREQLQQLVTAIEAAKADLAARQDRIASVARAVPVDLVTIERDDVAEIGFTSAPEADVELYREAVLTKPRHLACDLHEAPIGILTSMVEEVVGIEGPVYVDEVINRLRDAWGLRRAGGRIQEAVEAAIAVAVRQQRLQKEDDFLSVPGATAKVRDRSQVQSLSLRRPEALPPSELRKAIIDIVRTNFGANDDQIVQAVSRAVGFKSTSEQLRSLIQDEISQAEVGKLLLRHEDMLVLGSEASKETPHFRALAPLEKLIGEGEHEELEFKQTLRWDVELKEPNKKLEESVIKTIAGFANRNGGTLLIGVSDNGSVTGLVPDFACLGASRDKFELHVTNLLNTHFGQAFAAARVKVSFPNVGEFQICRIDVNRAAAPVFVSTGDKNGKPAERFFVRSGNSSQELPPSQMATYLKERFG